VPAARTLCLVKWVLLWVVLVLVAVAVLGWVAWGVVRKGFALMRELSRSAELVGPVLQALPEPYRPASSVLADPSTLPDPGQTRAGHRRSRAGHRRFGSDRRRRASGRVG
jgi:hypothetical protein